MTENLEKLFADLRTEALQEILPPGADEARRTVRRRQGAAASAGAVVAVTAIAGAIAFSGGSAPVAPQPSSSELVPPRLSPGPDTVQSLRMAVATKALGDPEKLPHVMATSGVVTSDYENHVNDMPADDYKLFVYCAGQGTVDVVVKAGNYGDTKLAAGTVTCAETPVPGQLSVRQPVDGYLRVFLHGDKEAAGKAAFSFKFVRAAEFKDPPSGASTANAKLAAQLLDDAGISGVNEVTTESNKTLDEPRDAGDYLASFGCAGPGTVSFIIRSAKTLRDGTVATDGQTEKAVSYKCTTAGKITKNVPMALPAGSAFTITAEADAAARNRAGWAYSFRAA